MLFNNIKYIKYTLKHKKAFLMIEKKLLGKNTMSGYLHDLDKAFLYLFLGKKYVSMLHRKYSRHHNKAHTESHYKHMLIDWECARYTKIDKPLNAYETLYKFYPELEIVILPLLEELGLVNDDKEFKNNPCYFSKAMV